MQRPCELVLSVHLFTQQGCGNSEAGEGQKQIPRTRENGRTGERGQVELMNFHNKKKACRMVTPSYVRWFITPSEYDYKIL